MQSLAMEVAGAGVEKPGRQAVGLHQAGAQVRHMDVGVAVARNRAGRREEDLVTADGDPVAKRHLVAPGAPVIEEYARPGVRLQHPDGVAGLGVTLIVPLVPD
ncbi:MAG: hypothetical protein WCO42_01130 [bacterium]